MSATDELLSNSDAYATSFARIQASPFIPKTDAVRGFVSEVETGTLREVR